MPPRTSEAEVRKILPAPAISSADLEGFITTANVMVTQVLGSDTTLLEQTKTEIEKFLTAHLMASTRAQQLAKAGGGDTRAEFQGEFGKGLESTGYGQTVKRLDVTGKLAALDWENRTEVVFFSVGGC